MEWKGIPAAAIMGQLKGTKKPLFEGGVIDLRLAGGWDQGKVGWLNLPLEVQVHDSTLNLGELGSAAIQHFSVPIHLRGPLDGLKLRIDTDELAKALREAGAGELERKLRAKVAELEGDVKARVDEEKKKLEQKAASEIEEKKDELQEKLGDEAKGALEGLLGGKKKKKDGN